MTIKITRLDLDYILTQIEMAEAGLDAVNPLLSFGLREIAGTNNNLSAGGSTFGSSLQPFPTITDPIFQNAQGGTSYAQTSGLVVDAQPRQISVLIATQTANNAAALAAQAEQLGQLGAGYLNLTLPGADGIYGTADDTGTLVPGADGILGTADDFISFGNLATPTDASASGATIPGLSQSLFIPNITPDARSVGAGQQLLHVLRPVLRPRPGQDHHKAATARSSYRCRRMTRCTWLGAPTNFMVETRATICPAPTASSAPQTTFIRTSTRPRRSSTRARPMAPTRRTRCSCANT